MWFKRIGLFMLTNILIVATISIITSIFGVRHYLDASGINFGALITFCLIWGMTGSFISLLLSKQMAKWMMGVKIIDPRTGGQYNEILNTVKRLSQTAKLPMPEVGVYESPEINAFATGPSKSSALVAVSTGLLQRMNSSEVEGVLAHELSHVANGDMVTMTLIQGIVNSFAMFLSRIISFAVGQMVKEDLEVVVRMVTTIVLDIVFSILGSLVVAYFSRQREFRADYGGAKLAGRSNMIAALESLKRTIDGPEDNKGDAFASMKISGRSKWFALFSTHPPLEVRIAALKSATIM
ncbi:MAG: protease HtpX [Leptospiraceae bacterium]|nr:protease HtpX [Leptospiraceae bacterium]MCK6380775.1 protease HtpX [Leptospiraceae bacterium]NUM41622.1 protease HtpX [Leptospiraceae bacterium]